MKKIIFPWKYRAYCFTFLPRRARRVLRVCVRVCARARVRLAARGGVCARGGARPRARGSLGVYFVFFRRHDRTGVDPKNFACGAQYITLTFSLSTFKKHH